MNIRNQSGDVKNRLLAYSPNAGESWEAVRIAQDLPDPVNEGSMINYRTGGGKNVLLFSNANSQTKREKMTVRVSQDDGKSWSVGREIYAGSAAYSDLVVQQNGRIGLLYEKDNYTKSCMRNSFMTGWLVKAGGLLAISSTMLAQTLPYDTTFQTTYYEQKPDAVRVAAQYARGDYLSRQQPYRHRRME